MKISLIVFFIFITATSAEFILNLNREIDLTKKLELQDLSENLFTTKLIIGTNKKELQVYVDFNQHSYAIYGYKFNKFVTPYFANESKAFALNKNLFVKSAIIYGYIATDVLNYNDQQFKLAFPYAEHYNQDEDFPYYPKYSGIIGLSADADKVQTEGDSYNFIGELKKNDYINSYYFRVEINNITNARLIIGEEFNNTLKKIHTRYTETNLYWNMPFDEIKFGDISLNDNIGQFKLGKYFLGCPAKYLDVFKNEFFNNYINSGDCSVVSNKFIICNKDNVNYNDFKTLKFFIYDIKKEFEFNADDLFLELGDKKLFLIEFEFGKEIWTLGDLFLQKYTILFNKDEKCFAFLQNAKKEKEESSGKGLLIFFICVLSFIIIGGILYYLFFLRAVRKKRATELIDDYAY